MRKLWLVIMAAALLAMSVLFYYRRNFYRFDENYLYVKRHYADKLVYLNRQAFYSARPYAYKQELKTVLLHPDYYHLPLGELSTSGAVVLYVVPFWKKLNNETQLKEVKAVFKNYNFRVSPHSVLITNDTVDSTMPLVTEFLTDSVTFSDSLVIYSNDKELCKRMGFGKCKFMHCRPKSLKWEIQRVDSGKALIIYFYGEPLKRFSKHPCVLYYRKRLLRLAEQVNAPDVKIKFFFDGYVIYNPKSFE